MIIIPILQTQKLSLRQVKKLTRGHRTDKCCSSNPSPNPGLADLKVLDLSLCNPSLPPGFGSPIPGTGQVRKA